MNVTRKVSGNEVNFHASWLAEEVYPRTVRQIFISRSAPQPAIMNTPTGGTKCEKVSHDSISSNLCAMPVSDKGRIALQKMVMMMSNSADTGLEPAIARAGCRI